MSITVVAPAFYPHHEYEYATRYLRISAARHNVPVRWYGVGEPYRGWLDVQITRLLAELRKVDTSHVLYTDSSDAIFLTGLEEIEQKYIRDYRNPEVLISVEHDGLVCAGGWMARTYEAIDTLEWLAHWSFDGDDGNPQTRWREAIADGEIDVRTDDYGLLLDLADTPLKYKCGRIVNDHGVAPCVLHFAGGYTDSVVGKAALIEPVWRELGYEPTT